MVTVKLTQFDKLLNKHSKFHFGIKYSELQSEVAKDIVRSSVFKNNGRLPKY
jgi:hypothetical protein